MFFGIYLSLYLKFCQAMQQQVSCFFISAHSIRSIWKKEEDSDDEEDEAKEAIKKLNLKKEVSKCELFQKVFFLNMFGEWGDRSQFTTVALAIEEIQAISLGALLGHFICCGLAVIGGKTFSTEIPEKYLNVIGGILFFLFGIQNALKTYYYQN